MKKEELLERVAPCSLVCHTCSAYEHGVICESAEQLIKFLDGMEEFYEKHSPEEVGRYRIFSEELAKYGAGICSGCRNREHHGCSIQGCFILECTQEHGVDFCGECEKFPCDRTKTLFEEEVYSQWLAGNEEIKLLGIEEFWNKSSIKPHYKSYKNPSD